VLEYKWTRVETVSAIYVLCRSTRVSVDASYTSTLMSNNCMDSSFSDTRDVSVSIMVAISFLPDSWSLDKVVGSCNSLNSSRRISSVKSTESPFRKL
jgi:hypothetical protein